MQVHFCDPLIKQEESGDAACDRCQPTALRVCLHNCPDHFWRKAASPDSSCFINGSQKWTCINAGANGPHVDCFLHPLRNWDCPNVATLSSKVCNDPVSFSKLEVLQSQRCYLGSSETTTDQKCEQSTIASAVESLSVFRAQQLLAFFRGQPVSDTYSQPSNTLHATYACRDVRAEEPAIRRFICQPAYCGQSQVDSRRSIWALFKGNPVSCDHRPIEDESRL